LFPPFRHPEPVSQPDDPYLLYEYIDGVSLAGGLFEAPEVIVQALDIIDRLPVLMRSLVLIPQFEQTLRLKESGLPSAGKRKATGEAESEDQSPDLRSHHQLQDFDQSFQWTRERTRVCCDFMGTSGICSEALLDTFQAYIQSMQSIHYCITGNNLCHTALVPEHLVLDSDDTLAVLGWHIAPRPKFYMLHSYLAWSALHSDKPDPFNEYRERLWAHRSKPFYDQHLLMTSFCLLDQIERCSRCSSPAVSRTCDEKLRPAEDLFRECIESLDQVKTNQPLLSPAKT
jgi:hypothetical protein